MNELEITVDRIHKMENKGGLKAFVDIKINDALIVKGLKVLDGRTGLFVGMPSEKGKDDKYYDNVIPLSKELREMISKEVLNAFKM